MNTILPGEAYGLRVVETVVEENKFLFYDGICNPHNPFDTVDYVVKRLGAFGYLERSDRYVLDVIDKNCDVIHDFGLTEEGFRYLRNVYGIDLEEDYLAVEGD